MAPSTRSAHLLDQILRAQSHVRVLRVLHELPQGFSVSGREVARRAGVSHPTASSALAKLAADGLVFVRRGLNGDAFELNREHILVEPLTELFDRERQLPHALAGFLREQILAHAGPVSAAFLFGSVVRDGLATASDIDLVVLCPADAFESVRTALDDIADTARRRFGRRLSAMVEAAPAADLHDRRRRRQGVWRRIREEGIQILPDREAIGA